MIAKYDYGRQAEDLRQLMSALPLTMVACDPMSWTCANPEDLGRLSGIFGWLGMGEHQNAVLVPQANEQRWFSYVCATRASLRADLRSIVSIDDTCLGIEYQWPWLASGHREARASFDCAGSYWATFSGSDFKADGPLPWLSNEPAASALASSGGEPVAVADAHTQFEMAGSEFSATMELIKEELKSITRSVRRAVRYARRAIRSMLSAALRYFNRLFRQALRGRVWLNRLYEFINKQRAWHVVHGAHPPWVSPFFMGPINLPGVLLA